MYEELLGIGRINRSEEEGADYNYQGDLRVLDGESVEELRTVSIGGGALVWNIARIPMRNAAGEIVGLCGIARDVTAWQRPQKPMLKDKVPYGSKSMQAALEMAGIAAARESIVLLLGESGSGKDHLAKWIHEHSRRANGPYFSINCAAIAPELAESELFGHEKGSFTGAVGRKRGLLELAEGGTLLLNEIGDLALRLQAKLLTFLDTRKFTRVGGEKEITVNARLIAATNRDLEKDVEAGRFRKDLFFRINVMSIEVPPLRNRPEDIPVLVQEILSKIQSELQLHDIPEIAPSALEKLKRYNWPGNVRELRNVLERALILSDGRAISLANLGLNGSDRCSTGDSLLPETISQRYPSGLH